MTRTGSPLLLKPANITGINSNVIHDESHACNCVFTQLAQHEDDSQPCFFHTETIIEGRGHTYVKKRAEAGIQMDQQVGNEKDIDVLT